MKSKIKATSPLCIIILGLFLLFFVGQPIPAGVCFLIGIVMIIEMIWPEKWGVEDPKNKRMERGI